MRCMIWGTHCMLNLAEGFGLEDSPRCGGRKTKHVPSTELMGKAGISDAALTYGASRNPVTRGLGFAD
jgi:hypothetical protein